MSPGPTFMSPETVIEKHKDGTLDPRQGIVALAREVIALRAQIDALLLNVQFKGDE